MARKYEISYKAVIDKGWHVYSQHLDPEKIGPVPTSFEIDKEVSGVAELMEVSEPEAIVHYDPNFKMDLSYFEDEVIFKQKIILKDQPGIFKGWLEFMVCDDKECLPPEYVDFEIDLSSGQQVIEDLMGDADDSKYCNSLYKLEHVDVNEPYSLQAGLNSSENNIDASENQESSTGVKEEKEDTEEETEITWGSLLLALFAGFGGGLIALVTPCVFPMIPLTVSYFTKGSKDKKKGKIRAFTYGLFILLIYTSIAIPFHIWNLPADSLNEIATNFWLNIFFFAIFIFFAGSFFGYYELTLPSSIANKADSASNKAGWIGIFFMALTLAIVSFSCTGPILGSLLVSVISQGAWPLTAALAGFGLALGIPFGIFAMFPQLMNRLPSSGGWLNSVKVVLGFVEVALAVKFLSNADLVYQFKWIHRETFFLIWFLISVATALYLFGVFKFPHDSKNLKLSNTRLGFATLFFAFAIYLFPGMLKNPWWRHGFLAGFPPPIEYSIYNSDDHHCPMDLDCTNDFFTAREKAVEKDKPIFIDFTGHACVNCRKMEENVWRDPIVRGMLEDEFQVVSLYVDDKRSIDESEQCEVLITYSDGEQKEKKIRTIGNKWSTLEIMSFEAASQPYYAILSPDGRLMNKPVGYTPDKDEYIEFLREGIELNKIYQEEKAKGLAQN